MAITTSYWQNDLDQMVADLPTTGRFPGSVAGTEFSCAASELSYEETLVLCGDVPKKAVRIVFAADAFDVTAAAFKPQARLQLKFPTPAAFVNYEIVSIQREPAGVGVEIVLKADNRSS
jgi:hypothetical protein